MLLRKAYYLKKSFSSLRYSSRELEDFQNRRLNEVLEAAEDIGYYSELVEGEFWEKEYDIDALGQFPVTDLGKTEISGFLEDGAEKKVIEHTSGTQGSPKPIKFDRAAYDWISSVFIRTQMIQGYFPGRVMLQYGDSPDSGSKISDILFPHRFIGREKSIEEQVRKIQEIEPGYLRYYPHVLMAITKKLDHRELADLGIETIFTYGELVTPSMKSHLAEAFDAEVRDQYATTEFGMVGYECDQKYHFVEDSVICRKQQIGSPEENTYRLKLTGIANELMPLLNYDIGDLVKTGREKCECKTGFTGFDRLRGREEDLILDADGSLVFPDEILETLILVEDLLYFKLVAEQDGYLLYYMPVEERQVDLEKIRADLDTELNIRPVSFRQLEQPPVDEGGKINFVERDEMMEQKVNSLINQ